MKLLVLLFVTASSAIPIPDDDTDTRSVDMMINGIHEGEPFEMGHFFDLRLNENANGAEIPRLKFPYSVQGLAEAAAIAAAENEVAEAEESAPTPELNPDPIFEPEQESVSYPEPVVLPEPGHPDDIVNTIPIIESELTDSEINPTAPENPNRGIYNNDAVSVTVKAPEDHSLLTTLQSWINMAINYISSTGVFTTQQIL